MADFKWNDSPEWKDFVRRRDEKVGAIRTPRFGSEKELGEIRAEIADAVSGRRLNALNVETLLEQTAELLDRVLRCREKIDGLRVADFNNAMELEEFGLLDEIHRKEIGAGRYDAPADEKAADLAATRAEIDQTTANLAEATAFRTWFGDVNVRAAVAANYAGVAAYPAPAVTTEVNKGAMRFIEVQSHALAVSDADMKQRLSNMMLQIGSLQGALASARQKAAAQEAALKYLDAARAFQKDRATASRKVFQDKQLATDRPGGPLNYGDQIGPLLQTAR